MLARRLVAFCLALAFCNAGFAAQGDPLAVRTWPNGVVTIETHWNLSVRIETSRKAQDATDLQSPSADLHVRLSDTGVAAALIGSIEGKQFSVETVNLATFDYFLDRVENDAELRWVAAADATFVSPNAVHLSSLGGRLLMIAVDGVRLVVVPSFAGSLQENSDNFFDELGLTQVPEIDAILYFGDQTEGFEVLARRLNAKRVILSSAGDSPGNTVALSASITNEAQEAVKSSSDQAIQIITLGTLPWEMNAELSELFTRKEKACRDSQAIFAELTVEQLNFKPSNGTHTPRWNSEHMMGRELLFFSQIYSKVDASIPVMNLNPKQMPPDYSAAHPAWTGAEEARQAERVLAFTRRFSYLLKGLDLDKNPAGSTWTPRGLLKQMQTHYGEHTANVVKKFQLDDWPSGKEIGN